MTPLDIALGAQEILATYVVQPVIILMLGVFAGKVVQQLIVYVGDEFLPGRARVKVIAVFASWAIYIGALAYALSSIGVLAYTLGAIVIAAGIVIALHLVLSARDFLANLWHFHAVRERFAHAATVRAPTWHGTLVSVQLADTHVRLATGEDLYVPNRTMRVTRVEIEPVRKE